MTRLWITLLLAATSLLAHAAEPAKKADARSIIAEKFPGMTVKDVRPSPVQGVYEVRIGADTVYVSADGRYVAFESNATNLVPGDTNNAYDVFVHDRQTQSTVRSSVRSDGTETGVELGGLHVLDPRRGAHEGEEHGDDDQ